jgi:hypothetical protein
MIYLDMQQHQDVLIHKKKEKQNKNLIAVMKHGNNNTQNDVEGNTRTTK